MKKQLLALCLSIGLLAPSSTKPLSASTVGNMATLTATVATPLLLQREGTSALVVAMLVLWCNGAMSVPRLYKSYQEYKKSKDRISIGHRSS